MEHSWSIEAWFHSKKRNRLSQTNVERFVRVHTNLSLEAALDGNSPINDFQGHETFKATSDPQLPHV